MTTPTTYGPNTARRIKRYVEEHDIPPTRMESEIRRPVVEQSKTENDVFAVDLRHYGGDAGDAENQCSWTYNVFLAGTETMIWANANIGVEPHVYRRPALGSMVQATAGLARWSTDGELVVYWCNEVPEVSSCADSAPPALTPVVFPV